MTRTTTKTTTTALGALATLLLVPCVLAGCSDGNRAASGTPGSETTSSAGRPDAGTVGACLRDKGYDVSDDQLGIGSGAAKFSVPDGVDADQWSKDQAICSGAGERAGEAAETKLVPGAEEAERKATVCIRGHGFPDYPDDDDDKASYHPADQESFDQVADRCSDEAFSGILKR